MSQNDQTWNILGQKLNDFRPDGPRDEHFDLVQKQMNEGIPLSNQNSSSIQWKSLKWLLIGLGLIATIFIVWANTSPFGGLSKAASSESVNTKVFTTEIPSEPTSDMELGGHSIDAEHYEVQGVDTEKSGELDHTTTPILGAVDGQSSNSSSHSPAGQQNDQNLQPARDENPGSGSDLSEGESREPKDSISPNSDGAAQDSSTSNIQASQTPVSRAGDRIALLSHDFRPAEVQSLTIDSLEIIPPNTSGEIRPVRQRRWSLSLGHMWHLRQNLSGDNEADPGLYYRLAYELPLSQKLGIRLHLGYRNQSAIRRGQPWLLYEEEVTVIPTNGSSTPVVFNYIDQYDDHDALSIGGELQVNFSRFRTRIGLVAVLLVRVPDRRLRCETV
ncbi:MAG: hypothetical protein AAFP08_14275 [Bacteroidota bacterium]